MDKQLERMQQLMGCATVEKAAPVNSIEYMTEGADGKMYGVIRENGKYYIKSAEKKENLVSENFSYIGGFANRKENEYDSCSKALKDIRLMMMELKEGANRDYKVEDIVDPERNSQLKVKLTEGMRAELDRAKVIMENAEKVGKGQPLSESEFKAKVGAGAQTGDPDVDPEYKEATPDNGKETEKSAKPSMKKASKPFGNAESDNGTGGVRKDTKNAIAMGGGFSGKKYNESREQMLERIIQEEIDNYAEEMGMEDDDEGYNPMGVGEPSQEELIGQAREDVDDLDSILDDLEYPEDEDLFDEGDDEEMEFDVEMEDEEPEPMPESRRRNRRAMSETRLHDFGRHPRYRQSPFSLPSNRHQEQPGKRDWNDESVENEMPYGQRIGSSNPFSISKGDAVTRATNEAIDRFLKKK